MSYEQEYIIEQTEIMDGEGWSTWKIMGAVLVMKGMGVLSAYLAGLFW